MRRLTRIAAGLFCICSAVAAFQAHAQAQTPNEVLGDWHGTIETPAGGLRVIVSIEQGTSGTLAGTLESVDQSPGQKIPLSTVTLENGRLDFAIDPLQASYEGSWDTELERWDGSWTQGVSMPLTLSRGALPARPTIEGLDGTWEGTVTRNGVDLRLVLRVRTSEAGTSAQFDSPAFAAFGLPVSDLTRERDVVRFTIPVSGAQYEGTLTDEADRMTGDWRNPGRPRATVTFVRTAETADRAEPSRPQAPTPPFPYQTDSVRVDNPAAEGVMLAGTLTLPEGAGPFPAAVLISGSGPQDRDETIFGHKPFAVLADHLTRSGIAVLRYDDRGFGESSGDFARATSADFATDADAAMRYLAGRPEIDPGAIGLIGHSEGGMVGPIAAAANDAVAYLVLLAGPGTDTKQLMLSQNRLIGAAQGFSESDLDRMQLVNEKIMTAVATAPDQATAEARVRDVLTPEALAALRLPDARREAAIEQFTGDWFRYFLQYDAVKFLSQIRVPVLALNGTLDRQVPADENLPAIEAALKHNPDVTVRKLEGLNHFFQTAETGALDEYAEIEETFSPEAMAVVSDWILARFDRR